jgi:hypothetical protein
MINTPLSTILPLHSFKELEEKYQDSDGLRQSMILFGDDHR